MSTRSYVRSGVWLTFTTFAGFPATAHPWTPPQALRNARSSLVFDIERVCLEMDGFEVNSYVVHLPEGDLVVDAGAEPEKILGCLKNPVAAILVTHGHP